jgi:hypothetical protein
VVVKFPSRHRSAASASARKDSDVILPGTGARASALYPDNVTLSHTHRRVWPALRRAGASAPRQCRRRLSISAGSSSPVSRHLGNVAGASAPRQRRRHTWFRHSAARPGRAVARQAAAGINVSVAGGQAVTAFQGHCYARSRCLTTSQLEVGGAAGRRTWASGVSGW